MSEFVVEPLSAQRVMEVYPLVRQIAPGVSLKSWQRHAAGLLRSRAGGRGIMLVRRAAHRFPCGLCSYRVDKDLREGLILTAEDATVMTTIGAREAYDALIRGIDQIALAHHCQAVRWLLLHPPEAVIDLSHATVWAPLDAVPATLSGRVDARP